MAGAFLLLLLASLGVAPSVARGTAIQAGEPLERRGQVVCADEAGRRQACRAESRSFALEDADGGLHAFLGSDPLAAIFQDPRVRERELLVRARPRPDGSLEIVKVFSIRGGTPHDVHYYCEVCHVTAYAPGPCPCCRRPMELRETPLP